MTDELETWHGMDRTRTWAWSYSNLPISVHILFFTKNLPSSSSSCQFQFQRSPVPVPVCLAACSPAGSCADWKRVEFELVISWWWGFSWSLPPARYIASVVFLRYCIVYTVCFLAHFFCCSIAWQSVFRYCRIWPSAEKLGLIWPFIFVLSFFNCT